MKISNLSVLKWSGIALVALLSSCTSMKESTSNNTQSFPNPPSEVNKQEPTVEKPNPEVPVADKGFGNWNPSESEKDCTEDSQLIFDSAKFTECLKSLEKEEAKAFLRKAFWADSLWIKSLETRRAAYLHLQKNRRQSEAKYLLDQVLTSHANVDPYQQEALRWLESEAEAVDERRALWKTKFNEIKNAIRVGNSKSQIEGRLQNLDRDVLDLEELNVLDSLMAKAESIDKGRLDKKWSDFEDAEKGAEKENLKSTILEKYKYLLSNKQLRVIDPSLVDSGEVINECETKRKTAAELIIKAKKTPKRKRELIQKALGVLKSCLSELPEGEYKEKVRGEIRRLNRWK